MVELSVPPIEWEQRSMVHISDAGNRWDQLSLALFRTIKKWFMQPHRKKFTHLTSRCPNLWLLKHNIFHDERPHFWLWQKYPKTARVCFKDLPHIERFEKHFSKFDQQSRSWNSPEFFAWTRWCLSRINSELERLLHYSPSVLNWTCFPFSKGTHHASTFVHHDFMLSILIFIHKLSIQTL